MWKSLSKWEKVFYIAVLVLAIFSRVIFLGDRAMSHDESIHTKFSWNLYKGYGFQHNPMMHGPLLFEMTALNYELFGANDFTSRLFVALVGVVLVVSPILYRRWLGSGGSAFASLLLLISPSITYYSRYIRHDIPLLLSAVVLLWALLHYVEDGEKRFLLYAAAAFSIMFATKEASYMYTLIFLILCAIPVALQLFSKKWQNPKATNAVLFITAVILLLGVIFAFGLYSVKAQPLIDAETGAEVEASLPVWARGAGGMAFILIFVDLVLIVQAAGEERIRENRWFDIVISLGTLTLPLGSAFIIQFIGGVDMDVVYNAILNGNFALVPTSAIVMFALVIVGVLAISIALGLWWNAKVWPAMAAIHYILFFTMYTTIFTWIFGALTGLVGGLAYWLGEQDTKRGGQPFFYYGMIGGLYEYLPILLGLVSSVMVFLGLRTRSVDKSNKSKSVLTVKTWLPWFLIGWTVLSWVIYTWAGEKMPWLVVHIALPSIFLSSIAAQRLFAGLQADKQSISRWGAFLWIPGFVAGVVLTIRAISQFLALRGLGNPQAGYTLEQLNAVGAIIGSVLLLLASSWLTAGYTKNHGFASLGKMAAAAFMVLFITLTVRTNVMANYINDGLAKEFLVYAHGTPDIKLALEQTQEISWITNGSSHDIKVAYGEDGSWPLTWYMSDYPNAYFYASSPDRDTLLSCPVIIAGSNQYDVVDPIVSDTYSYYDYKYLWWPIQDYFGLTVEKVISSIKNPEMRAALWDIAWARDYDAYAILKNPQAPFSVESWPLRNEFRLYVRNDLAQQAWGYDYGTQMITTVKPEATVMPDPYTAGARFLPAEGTFTLPGAAIRGFTVAEDGTLYVTDTNSHKVWHVDMDGTILDSIGGQGNAQGQFLEPWDVALDEGGNIYVTDTWNHRIQKFDTNGQYITQWGVNGMAGDTAAVADQPVYFFGPRGIAYHEGEIFVTDTGNKRVQVFNTEGDILRAFGGTGYGAGQFDEPVGIAINDDGVVAIADTWHRWLQLVTTEGLPITYWEVPVWDTANPEVKPYTAINSTLIAVTDPVHRRVLIFNREGMFLWALSAEAGTSITFAQSIVLTEDALYLSDTYSSTLTRYLLPQD